MEIPDRGVRLWDWAPFCNRIGVGLHYHDPGMPMLETTTSIVVALALGAPLWLIMMAPAFSLKCPEGVSVTFWNTVQPNGLGGAGVWIGALERLVALLAAWQGQYELVAGWLAFKVAAKWESWSNTVSLPDTFPGLEPQQYLLARRAWGSVMFGRFVFATAANILLGFIAMPIGKWLSGFCG